MNTQRHLRNMTLWPRFGLCIALLCSIGTPYAFAADSAQSQVNGWTAAAKTSQPAFSPSAERGRDLYLRKTGHNPDMASCVACHTVKPSATGQHAITSKTIAPMAPQSNPERFTDAAKTEKWFKRNCNDVLGRACTDAEKADFVNYLLSVK
jgi:cytochrome c peroxidase